MRLAIPLALALALLGDACQQPSQDLPAFAHDAALKNALTQLETQIASEADGPTDFPAVEAEEIGGLVHMLAHSTGRTRSLPLVEIKTLGDGVIAPLVVIASLAEREPAERLAAIELLAEVGGVRATEHMLQLCEKSPQDWIRRQAAWRLGSMHADWVVPRLILRLKYELDHETALWIADALGQYGNYSGQVALWTIRREGLTAEVRQAADERLVALAELAELAGADDADQLWQLWFVADPDQKLLRADPSPRLRRAVWQLISELSGQHFQLRGVDDARFVLSQMGSWATEPLARALHDDDVYVRVHSAQCLERMGPRAVRAGPTLMAGLADPDLATAAAAALGVVAFPSAEPLLRRLMLDETCEYELRVACTSSLGRIGLPVSQAALSQVLESEAPFDLRQRAAISLCQLGAGRAGAEFLLKALDDERADRFGAEVALGEWLASLEGVLAEELLAQWQSLGQSEGLTTSEQAAARIRARAELLKGRLAELGVQ